MSTAVLFITLFGFMAIGMPVAISLGLSSLLTILFFADDSLASLSIKLYETSEHYTLLSIPVFILAGAMMSTGGVAKRMVRFAVAAVGHLRGGLAIASVLACTLFAAVSGDTLGAMCKKVLDVRLVPRSKFLFNAFHQLAGDIQTEDIIEFTDAGGTGHVDFG